ncbi:MAG: TonB-dependent receptor plug domain-containing protein, partial [Pseudomonadota bacterium]
MLDRFVTQAPIREKFRILSIALTAAAVINLLDVPALLLAPQFALMEVCVIAGLSIAAVMGIMTLTSERICRPYVDTVLRMEALAAGDTRSPVAYTHHADCVGRMTKAMETFRDTIEKTTNVLTPEDTMKYLPNVLIRQRHIGDTQSPIATRTSGVGASARSLIYIDGILVSALFGNNNSTASPKWGLIAPDAIDRVDVLYGPFAAAYAGRALSTNFEGS